MLLILTNGLDATADFLAGKLDRAGVRFVRFDTDSALRRVQLAYDAVGPTLAFDGALYRPDQFDGVWYRRPEPLVLPGVPDETPETEFVRGEWSAALEGFFAHIPAERWMNHPAREASASHKLEQLSRARAIGFVVPDTIVTQEPEELRNFAARHGGRVVVKPMATGHIDRKGEGADTVIFTNRVSPEHLGECDDLRGCPTLFQQEVRKRSDVRITVVDDDVHAVELTARDPDGRQRCDIRRNHMGDVTHAAVSLPGEVLARVRDLVRGYGLRYGAIDMAVTEEGDWVFFEINPNGQWAWMDLRGATRIAASFVKSFGG